MSKILNKIVSGGNEFLIQDHRLPDGDITTGGTVNPGYGLKKENDEIYINNLNCSANSANYALALGIQSIASGAGSYAFGINVSAYSGSFAEGLNNYATLTSHVEGNYNSAIGILSHAEGFQSKSVGDFSHAEGYNTSAIGYYSHAEGFHTLASGEGSHAEGLNNIVNSDYSHVAGEGNIAATDYSTVIGKFNVSATDRILQVGIGTSNNNRKDCFYISDTGETFFMYGDKLVSLSSCIKELKDNMK